MQSMNSRGAVDLTEKQGRPDGPQTIAVQIRGALEDDQTMSDAGFDVAMADKPDAKGTDEETDVTDASAEPKQENASSDEGTGEAKKAGDEAAFEEAFEKTTEKEEEKKREINVVYVADVDLLISTFLRIRARPDEDEVVSWNFENVTFLLNIVDVLSGDDNYVEIRKRKPRHSTLKIVEFKEQEAREREFKELVGLRDEFATELKKIEDENKKEIEKANKKLQEMQEKRAGSGGGIGISLAEFVKVQQEYNRVKEKLERRKQVQEERMRRQEDDKIDQINREIDLEIAQIKNWYKFLAVALPPIPPLFVGLIVFVRRRLREREGIEKSRMR